MSGYVCEELIFEIFTRLPSKSLIRFRLLSKSLSSYIVRPDFIRMHTFRSPQKIMVRHLFGDKYGVKDFYTLHKKDQLPTYCRRYVGIKPINPPYIRGRLLAKCVGSYNGIICLVDCENGISLWNPSIRRILTLRDCLVRCSSRCPRISSSRCPRRCAFCGAHRVWIGCGYKATGIGFGFDSITDDYKIVILPKCGGTEQSSYIYSVKTDAWCAITSPTPLFCKVTSHGCLMMNGALHWMVRREVTVVDGRYHHYYILTFDLSTHVFGKIALPKPTRKTKQLTIIHGSLAVVSSKDEYSCIWVMREYNNTDSWCVFFKSKRNKVEGELKRVLQLTNNSNLLLFNTLEEGFQVYDPQVRARSRLRNHDTHSFIFDMELYVESLQLFDMGTACLQSIFEEKRGRKKTKILP